MVRSQGLERIEREEIEYSVAGDLYRRRLLAGRLQMSVALKRLDFFTVVMATMGTATASAFSLALVAAVSAAP